MSVLKLLLFAREKIILITPYTAVSRSIMGLGRIDMEGVAGGGIEVFKVKRNIIYVSLAVVWFGKETVYPIHYSAGFAV